MQESKPLIVLGLDGLDPEFVSENLEDLPNLKSLVEKGNTGRLESILPPVTIPAWGCAFSGLRPERVDRFDFHVVDFDDYSFEPQPRDEFLGKEFWRYTDSKSAIVDVPCAVVDDINGYITRNFFSADGKVAYPDDVAEELEEKLEDISEPDGETKIENAHESFEARKDVFNWFLNEKDGAEVYFIVFRLTDTLMHHCETDEQLVDAYKKADSYLGELMDREADIIVVSDHGAEKADRKFAVNTWLKNKGFLDTKESEKAVRSKLIDKVVDGLVSLGFRSKLAKLNSLYGDLTGEKFKKESLELDSIDWQETEAFSYMIATCRYAGIWINDERFPSPAVEDREEKKQEIKELLEQHGKVEEVLTAEEAFVEKASTFPDLVVKYVEGFKQTANLLSEETGAEDTYMHRKQGFIGLYGDVFDSVPEGAELVDLAPTVLHYLGQEIPAEMDGSALDIFDEDSEPGSRKPEKISNEVAGLDI